MYAIFKKEIRNYFFTPIGYIFISPFLALCAMFFISGVSYYQTATVDYILGPINIICLFIVPVLTMQLFSEERNKKSDQLLLTSPVNISSIVLGKYFAALCVFCITLAVSLIFPIILFIIGKPVLSEVIGTYIGFILIWAAFIAIGVFISSLTESQVVAAILSFVVLLVLYSLDGWTQGITTTWLKNIISWFSIFKRYSDFQIGLLSLPNVIYYLSFIFVFLFLTGRSIEKRRYS